MINTKYPDRKQETRTVLAIAMPLMAAYLAEMGMLITDMIIVGRLGSNELAAVGLAADWFYVLLLIGMGVISIVGVFVAQCYGAGDDDGVRNSAEQGLLVATLCSVPVMAAIWFLGNALRHTGQDPDVIRLIIEYSQPLALGVIPALWFVVLRNYVTALARAGGIMAISFFALPVNIALNYTLVFGHLGFPAMGVAGAAIGTSIVNWLMFAVLALHVVRSPHFNRFRPKLIPHSIDLPLCREIFRLGLPITGAQIIGGTMFTVAAVAVGALGSDILAAQMIVYSVIYFGLSMSVAFGDAIRVRVAYGIGAGSIPAARQSFSIATILGALFVLAATLILWVVPEVLVGVYLDIDDAANAGVLAIAVGLSFYAGFFQLVDGVLIMFSSGLRGLRDTQSPLWIGMFGYWIVGLGAGSWLALETRWGAVGMWAGLIGGAIVALSLMIVRLRQRFAEADLRLHPPHTSSA